MLINLSFSIPEEQQELLSVICSLIKTSFKCKLDISVNKEQVLGRGSVLPELDFIDMTSDSPRDFYVEREGRQIGLTKTDFLRYCEILLSKKMELSEPKEQLEFLRSAGVSFPSIQKAFDLTESEFMSLRSDLVFPYVKAKWQRRFSCLRANVVDDKEAIEAMRETFKERQNCIDQNEVKSKMNLLAGISNVDELLGVMKKHGISQSQICREAGTTMAEMFYFLKKVYRVHDEQIIAKLNARFKMKLQYEDRITPFLAELKEQLPELDNDQMIKLCKEKGISPFDISQKLKIKRPSVNAKSFESFRRRLEDALGLAGSERRSPIPKIDDFKDCETYDDFVEVCCIKQYEAARLAEAIGISEPTARTILKRTQKIPRHETLCKISKFIGHDLVIRRVSKSLMSDFSIKLSEEKLDLIETLRQRFKQNELDGLSDQEIVSKAVRFFRQNKIGYNVLASLLGFTNANYKTISKIGAKKFADWIKN